MIDWTQPIETTETPPWPVRVLATDLPGNHPVLIHYAVSGLAWCRPDGSDLISATRSMINFRLRNVAPPKPELVLREAWINCYAVDNIIGHATKEAADKHGRPDHREACIKVAWMSDGSPVPGEGKTAEYKADRDWLSQKYQDMIAERDSLKSEVEKLRRANATQAKIYERQKPVVDAAIVWERHFTQLAGDRLVVAVRAYQSAPKKTAEEAVANVAEMMGPVKNCTTCGALSRNALCKNGVWTECTNSNYGNWEPRHD